MRILLLFISIFTCIGCTQTNRVNKDANTPSEYNEQQTRFIEFMQALYHEHRNRPNNLDLDRFDKKMHNYLDSIQPLIGWKGTISEIDLEIVGNKKHYRLSFDINFEYTGFNCSLNSVFFYRTEKELRDSEYYKKLINVKNGSSVYFDGFIERAYDGELTNFNENDTLKYLAPIYLFNTFEIYTTAPTPLSPQLMKQLSLIYQRYCLYCKKDYKKITDIEYKQALSAMPKVNGDSLSNDEKKYLDRCIKELTASLFEDIMSNP